MLRRCNTLLVGVELDRRCRVGWRCSWDACGAVGRGGCTLDKCCVCVCSLPSSFVCCAILPPAPAFCALLCCVHSKGILSLINRGLLPSTIDVTAAFREGRSVVQNAARMHDWSEQFVPTSVYTSPFGFSAANIKLDLAPAPATATAPPLHRTASEPRRPGGGGAAHKQTQPHRQTMRYQGPEAPNPIRRPRGQPELPPPPASPVRTQASGAEPTAAEEELRDAVDKVRVVLCCVVLCCAVLWRCGPLVLVWPLF